MKTIPLSQGKTALVDDADYEELAQFKWSAMKAKRTWYAIRHLQIGHGKMRKRRAVLMHRQILGVPSEVEVDHQDGDGLNNQRYNLRPATSLQNSYNNRGRHTKTSRFKGVSLNKRNGRWKSFIIVNYRYRHLGDFTDEVDAARAYNAAATQAFGEFARLNLV